MRMTCEGVVKSGTYPILRLGGGGGQWLSCHIGTIDSFGSIFQRSSIGEVSVTRDDISVEKADRPNTLCHSLSIPLRRFQSRLEDITTPDKSA